MDKTTAFDIMSTELLTIREHETVEDALKILVNNRISGVPVVDANNKMIGVLSEFDLIRQISDHPTHSAFQDKIIYTKGTLTIPTTTKLQEILKYFIDSKYRRLPVVDSEQRLVGIITRPDLMKLFFYRAQLT